MLVGSKQVRPKRTLLLVFLSETEKIHFLGGLVCLVAEDSALEEAKYRAWGHEYVITSLLENAVILETIKKEGIPLEATLTYPTYTSFKANLHTCA